MNHVYSTTTKHEKRKHLFYDEQALIQIRLKDEWSDNKISKEIVYPPNTVRNNICRGTISLYRGNVKRCKTEVVQQNRPADSVIFRKYMASFSVKCSRQSDRQLRDMDF